MILWEKNFRTLCFYKDNVVEGISNKKVKGEIGIFFRHPICNTFTKVFLQHFLKMMSNFVENDGYACFTKMLGFASKSFKMVELTSWIDLLFSETRHFVFWKTAFSELGLRAFSACFFYATPKFRCKIHDSGKSVENLLTIFKLALEQSVSFLLRVFKPLYNEYSWS